METWFPNLPFWSPWLVPWFCWLSPATLVTLLLSPSPYAYLPSPLDLPPISLSGFAFHAFPYQTPFCLLFTNLWHLLHPLQSLPLICIHLSLARHCLTLTSLFQLSPQCFISLKKVSTWNVCHFPPQMQPDPLISPVFWFLMIWTLLYNDIW